MVDTIVSDPQPEHECLGFFDAPKENPPRDRDSIFETLRFLEGTPIQSLVRKGLFADLALPSTSNVSNGCHCPYLELYQTILHLPWSYPVILKTLGLGSCITSM